MTTESEIFQDLKYKELIELALQSDELEKITKSVGGGEKISDVRRITYDNIIHRSEFQFIQHRRNVYVIGFVILFNILANWFFYNRYLLVENDLISYIQETDSWFVISILLIVLSIAILPFLFLFLESPKLYKLSRYLAAVEIMSILGVAAEMFWAALFSWSALASYFLFSVDLNYIKPNKKSQLKSTESDKPKRKRWFNK